MKGETKTMNELENKINITLTKEEYEYLKELCNSMYKGLKQLPKKMRTPKFYLFENMINTHFTK